MSVRLILTYGDVITDIRTDDQLTIDGVETFARIAYETHEKAIAYSIAIQTVT